MAKRRTEAQNKAISNKIAKLRGEGFPAKQATAIAMRMYREGEIKARKAPKKRAAAPKRRPARRPTRRTRK